jgi:hypothetical protein
MEIRPSAPFRSRLIAPVAGGTAPVPPSFVPDSGREGSSELDPDAAPLVLRRFFQYLILLGLLVVSVLGLSGLLAEALSETFPRGTSIARVGAEDLALAVTFVVVGGPLLVVMAVWTRHRFAADSGEKDSLGWSFYLTVSLLTSLAAIMFVAAELLDWALSVGRFDTRDLAEGIVWAVVWVVHWLIARIAINPVRLLPQLLVGSAAGLGVLVAAMALALNAAHESLYAEAFSLASPGNLEDMLRKAAPLFVVGALVWWWYWIQNAARRERSLLWNGYILLIGVLGGLLTALVAAGGLIATGLDWYIGDPESTRAVVHFDLAPGWVTALLIGAVVWLYHRFLLGAAADERTGVHRVYDYMVSGVGLVAVAAGVATAIVVLLVAATGSVAPARRSEGELLVVAITLLIIGLPLWWATWTGIKRRAVKSPDPELRSGARRVYLFVLFGVGGVTAIVGLISFVFVVIRDLLDGNLGTRSVRDADAAIGILISALAVAGYHWSVYQQDRKLVSQEEVARLREVILVCADGERVAAAIRTETGARVVVIERDDDVAGTLEQDEVVAALRERDAERVVVVGSGLGAFEIIPFRR